MQHTTRSHAHHEAQQKQFLNVPDGYGRGRDHSTGLSMSKSDPAAQNADMRARSADRGRTMRRRYEFIDESPVKEAADKKNNDGKGKDTDNAGRESTMTTMTDLMQQCMEPSPPKLPVRQNRQQQANMDVGTSVTQQSLPQPKPKRRPTQLNLQDPVYVGMISRHRQRYEVEHIPIKSSQAEFFNLPNHYPTSSVYDEDDGDEEPLTISPLHIPKCTERSVNFLEVYSQWRDNLKPVRTASQGSINIRVPTKEEDTFLAKKGVDEDRLPIADYPVARESPVVNHVRSRSSLGFREDRDRQFPGDFESEAIENGVALASGLGSGVKRSATTNDIPHRSRQPSGGSRSKACGNDVEMPLDQEWGGPKSVSMSDVASRMEIPPSPYTPLTPFIMKATGAPSFVGGGSKTLFGDHGWLEDTAASGPKKPKVEKKGGFMESLKQKAREFVSHTST
ncbi:hypothetical protein HD806DRAFT_364562 [Xylariaceae sp. AK1471]|nr:hypothetical protein HD806DRAFT_364562 [Xylariaceae sp. AK1471]